MKPTEKQTAVKRYHSQECLMNGDESKCPVCIQTKEKLSQVKHSPTPWKVAEGKQGVDLKTYIYSEPSCMEIAMINTGEKFLPSDESKANAAFIVKACNAHEALVMAAKIGLEAIKEIISDAGPCDHSVNICVCGYISYAEQVDAAISLAERR